MIEINKKNIDLEKYPLSLSEFEEIKRDIFFDVKVIEFTIKDDSNEIFDELLKTLMNKIIETHKLYFIYVEGIPQVKNKIRSLKKMFRSQKSKIGNTNLFELETDIKENQSIISAIVKVDKQNIDFCLNELMNSNLSFGYASLKEKRSFKTNRTNFLHSVVSNKIEGRKSFEINLLKSINQNLNYNKLIFDIKTSGRDEEIIKIFTKNDFNSAIEEVEFAMKKYMKTM